MTHAARSRTPSLAALAMRLAVAALLASASACGGAGEAPDGGALEGADTSAGRAQDTTRMTVGPPCETFSENPERLDLQASWQGDQVRVEGVVAAGAGNALSIGLSQAGRFVYDRVFRADLMGVIQLEGDVVDLTTVTNEPTAAERRAFSRTGAAPLDPSLPVCVDVMLYERGSLDRLAERHLIVEGSPAADE